QVESGLSLAAKPTSFSHKHKATVVFTVTDAGQPVAGAGVSCLGKAGKTNASGQVKLAFPKGSPVGHHVCTAARVFYAVGKTTITVT
ncbi:MAG TPA: hypothetical protein VFD49_13180, partial [Candidatus Dormibacteraeota bacterium]|nr:hypothetical protein [Candidatus Dormibacteraeota bacterium]